MSVELSASPPARSTCLNCGSHVTPDFTRVFGTEDGEALRCGNCATLAALRSGAAANPDFDGVTRL